LKMKAHQFKTKTLKSPKWCELCGAFVYGLTRQGKVCSNNDCDLVVHHKCAKEYNEDNTKLPACRNRDARIVTSSIDKMPVHSGLVRVQIIGASSISASSKCDPYVQVGFLRADGVVAKGAVRQTCARPKTNSPEWGDVFDLIIDNNDKRKDQDERKDDQADDNEEEEEDNDDSKIIGLLFEVRDHKRVGGVEFMGCAPLLASEIHQVDSLFQRSKRGGADDHVKLIDRRLRLLSRPDKGDKVSGSVHVKIWYCSDALRQRTPRNNVAESSSGAAASSSSSSSSSSSQEPDWSEMPQRLTSNLSLYATVSSGQQVAVYEEQGRAYWLARVVRVEFDGDADGKRCLVVDNLDAALVKNAKVSAQRCALVVRINPGDALRQGDDVLVSREALPIDTGSGGGGDNKWWRATVASDIDEQNGVRADEPLLVRIDRDNDNNDLQPSSSTNGKQSSSTDDKQQFSVPYTATLRLIEPESIVDES
jgi:Phorbol esters/diacylglycerol binding domain (C1 domain)/C2 domain